MRRSSRIASAMAFVATAALVLTACGSSSSAAAVAPAVPGQGRRGQPGRVHRRPAQLSHPVHAVVQGRLREVQGGDRCGPDDRDVCEQRGRNHQDPGVDRQRNRSRCVSTRHHVHAGRLRHQGFRHPHRRRLGQDRRPSPLHPGDPGHVGAERHHADRHSGRHASLRDGLQHRHVQGGGHHQPTDDLGRPGRGCQEADQAAGLRSGHRTTRTASTLGSTSGR